MKENVCYKSDIALYFFSVREEECSGLLKLTLFALGMQFNNFQLLTEKINEPNEKRQNIFFFASNDCSTHGEKSFELYFASKSIRDNIPRADRAFALGNRHLDTIHHNR